jgi:hypothetical protein
MTKLFRFTLVLALLLVVGLPCLHAQATLNTTTLSTALTGTPSSSNPGLYVDVIYVASTSNFVQNSVGQWTTLLYVDFEAMDVVQVLNASAGQVRVVRGAYGTKTTYHNAGALIYIGPPNFFGGASSANAATTGDPAGACVLSTIQALPYININDGKIFQCLSSGQWLQTGFGTMGSAPAQLQTDFCTGTVASAQTEYLNDTACSGATTALAPTIQVSRGTIYGLSIASSANVTGGSSVDVATVFKNGSSTAITCTIAAAAKTCSDTTHSVAVAPGDQITFQFVTATSDTAANITMSIEKQ